MFLPTTPQEMQALGWDRCDVVLVSGDAYIDSPYMGVSVIGHVLYDAGYRVGLIGQPDMNSADDIARLGEPRLFWGISGGGVDSLVANYTALKKRRKSDDFTPGGVNDRRPDRAVIAYCNLIRRHFKATVPLVLGGVEASLRRIAHYDYWSNRIRRSILFDAKADLLVFGMGETVVLEIAAALAGGGRRAQPCAAWATSARRRPWSVCSYRPSNRRPPTTAPSPRCTASSTRTTSPSTRVRSASSTATAGTSRTVRPST